jgi:hypothetical protein
VSEKFKVKDISEFATDCKEIWFWNSIIVVYYNALRKIWNEVELFRSHSGLHLKLYILLFVRLSVLFMKLFNKSQRRIVLFFGDIFMSLSSSM